MEEFSGPELRANWCSKLFYCWLNPTFSKANRRTLELEDVYRVPKSKRCDQISRPFIRHWDASIKSRKPSLWSTICRTVWLEFFVLGIIYFLKECILQIYISILLGRFLRVYGLNDESHLVYWTAFLILFWSAVYLFVTNQFTYHAMDMGFTMGVGLTTIIYRKTLRLNASSLSGTTSGELTNLLSSDIKRFESPIGNLHSLWAGPLLIVISGTVLYQRYGWDAISGLFILALIALLGVSMAKFYARYRKATAEKTSERLKIIDEIISGIRFIKTYTWELLFEANLETAREAELAVISRRMNLLAFYTNLSTISRRIIILVFLAFTIFLGKGINSEKVFVTLSLYNTAASIMTGIFPSCVLMISEILVAVKRMEKFLLLPEDMDKAIQHRSGKPPGFITEGRVNAHNYSGNWLSTGKRAITNINFNVRSGQSLFVLGHVGSGKSSLISAVLGFLKTDSGSIETEGSLSYAPQNPWVFTGTIKENILFGQALVDPWYQTVLDACALIHDIQMFTYGDNTLIGDKGISLSGGQKARISLARAVYAISDIYLLDDVLSAVDAEVGREIFRKVIQGLLREKCILMATHQVQYVEKNRVICLKDGHIEDSGYRDEVEARNPQLFKTLEEMGNEVDQQVGQEATDSEEEIEKIAEAKSTKSYGTFGPRDDRNTLQLPGHETAKTLSTSVNVNGPLLQPREKESRRTGVVGLGLCFRYLWQGNSIFRLIILLSVLIMAQVLLSSVDMWLSIWTNNVENEPSSVSYYYFGVYCILLATDFAVGWLGNYQFFKSCIKAGRQLHNKATSGLIRSKPEFFETNPAGRILNRFSKDMAQTDEYLPTTVFAATNYGLQILGIFAISSILNPALVIPSLIVVYILIKIRAFYLKASSDIKRLEAVARSPVFSLITTTLDGISTIKAFRQEDLFQKRFEILKDTHSGVYFMYIASFTWLLQALNVIGLLYEMFVVVVFVLLVTHKSAAGLAITSVFTLGQLFSSGMQRSAELENDLVSVERLEEYGALPSEAPLFRTSPQGPQWEPRDGSITVEKLEVQYGNKIPVLHNITCAVRSGEKIGIVGRTGAGKSSLVSAILRLLEPSYGRILIGGTDIQTLGLHELRSKISIISQVPGFLRGSLRRNLDPFDKYSDNQLWDVLNSVQLAGKVKELSKGLFHEVAVGGMNFSQGERQLISLARALLCKNPILVLDEATASVDFTTDEIIQREVREKCANCTVITIAHRIETVLGSDRICVMHDGRIEEFDSPKRLLQDDNSRLSMLLRKSHEQANLK